MELLVVLCDSVRPAAKRGFGCACAVMVTAVAALSASAGFAQDSAADSAGIEYFEKHIRNIFVLRCYECHSEGRKVESGLRLDERAGWMTGGERGRAVVAGDVEASLLIRAVRYQDPDLKMPPSQALPAAEISRLEHWIRMGAPAPDGSSTLAIGKPSDPEAGKTHWAFQPLHHSPPPAVQNAAWARSPIDRYALARLEQEGLAPGPDAGPRDLVRRAYVQLTGLSPTREQIEAIERDDRPDAFAGLVDHLLSTPQFGERWGRHWLDLARYADSNGLDENFLLREAWRYRNWVIRSVNADVPFDRFVEEQIAGDLLPFDSVEQRDQQRIAAGFLLVGPKVLLNDDAQKQKMEVADELIETIGRVFLGQTLGCARCHDHKFDPIPTADYYALAGILTSTQIMERRFMLNEQRVMERLAGLGEAGDTSDNAYEEFWREHPNRKNVAEKAKAFLEALKSGDSAKVESLAKENGDACAPAALDSAATNETRIAAQEQKLAELTEVLSKPPAIPARAMIPAEAEAPADEFIRQAGQFDRPGEQVPRGFLKVLLDEAPAPIAAESSGRLALARWLTDEEGRAGQLAARILANRIWHHLMGRGLVRTVDNFGRTGETPSHPELLDYLAQRLIDSGWSVKAVVREIVLSRTFALSSQHDERSHAADPENELLWRGNRRRLDPESLRDAMLLASGQLDPAPMDSTVNYLGDQATAVGDNKVRRRTDFVCRSLYLPVIRNDLPELFQAFDFTDPHAATGARPATIVPTQSLFLMNDVSVMDAALATARRVLAESVSADVDGRIDRLFDVILAAPPTAEQREAFRSYLKQTEDALRAESVENVEERTWASACHALFATSLFEFLE